MAKVISKRAVWQTPSDPSVVSHNLYYVRDGETLDYNSPKVNVPMPATQYDLPGDCIIDSEGDWLLGLSSMDQIGNESDMATRIIPLDFTPPAMPVGFDIV